MFEKATKLKIRFETNKGMVTVEDLWDMPLTSKDGFNLDEVAKKCSKKIKESEEESFVATPKKENTLLALKLELVKHVIAIKIKEKEEKESLILRKEKKDRILKLIQEKQDEELSKKSIADLTKELEEL